MKIIIIIEVIETTAFFIFQPQQLIDPIDSREEKNISMIVHNIISE